MIDMTKQVTVTKTGLDVMTHVNGQFFTFGKITLLKKNDLIVLVSAGDQAGKKVRLPMTYPCTVDGVEYVVDAPAEEAPVVVEGKAKREKAAPGQPTKMDKCRAIFKEDGLTKTKSEVILRFINEAGCTPAGANTYYLTCRKG